MASLKAGKEALISKRYTEAIAILSEYCHEHLDPEHQTYTQAQMWLSSAYQRSGRADKAIAICELLADHPDPQIKAWSAQSLKTLQLELGISTTNSDSTSSVVASQPSRYRKPDVTLSLNPLLKLNFGLAMFATVSLTLATIMGILLWLISFVTITFTWGWIKVAIALTFGLGTILFFMSPWIIDIIHKQLYRTQWITLNDLESKSPETVEIIERFCQSRKMEVPRLGLVEDSSPVAFIYGVLPNSMRLVLSRGLFLNLDNDEIAAVVAHQLGHVANWSCSVTTFATAPTQIIYLIYTVFNRAAINAKFGNYFWQMISAIALLSYRLSNYICLPTSRSSAYLCDHFAAAITGNPNAIARALPKMARGIATNSQLGQVPSRLLESSRSLGTCDYKTAISVGITFEILYSGYSDQSDQSLYRVFLWELFNPWATWVELHATQPLIGRRLQVLTTYAQQLGLKEEYEFIQLLNYGKTLNKSKLSKTFFTDLLIETAPYTGVAIGLITSMIFYELFNNWLPFSLCAIGLGIGVMFQGSLRYPDYSKVVSTNLVSLLLDPYASTLRGRPVQIPGELVSYGTNQLPACNLKLEDQSGLINLNYFLNVKSFFNSTPVIEKIENLIGESVITTGWFRRGDMPVLDVSVLEPVLFDTQTNQVPLNSYHQLWNNFLSSVTVLGGLILLAVTSLVNQ